MFWTEQDILEYVVMKGLRYADIYGDIIKDCHGKWVKTGEQRTGCKYCLFGVHMKKGENQFQRLARIEPQSHKKAVEEWGYDKVLEHIGLPWKPDDEEAQ